MDDLRVRFPKPCSEAWEDMTPAGRNRLCQRCDTIIHDLSNYTIDEIEALLRTDPGSCVRARIGPDGKVAVKPPRSDTARRIIVAGASIGLLAASVPASVQPKQPTGVITGKVTSFAARTRIIATSVDGKTYRGKAKVDGRYTLKNMPVGIYTLTFVPDCGTAWTVANVLVEGGEAKVLNSASDSANECIIVGKILADPAMPQQQKTRNG